MESRGVTGMNPEPRQREDYSARQIEAAHRVLVDLGQVLKQFEDCLVVVGGWIPAERPGQTTFRMEGCLSIRPA